MLQLISLHFISEKAHCSKACPVLSGNNVVLMCCITTHQRITQY